MRDIKANGEVRALIGAEKLRELHGDAFVRYECWHAAALGAPLLSVTAIGWAAVLAQPSGALYGFHRPGVPWSPAAGDAAGRLRRIMVMDVFVIGVLAAHGGVLAARPQRRWALNRRWEEDERA